MKEQLGNIWWEPDSRGVWKIGFSREYIENRLGECFHVIQADTKFARKGCPLMVLETNDGTERVKSPLNGSILMFSDKARNFPDRLSEEDVVIEVLPEGVKLPVIEKAAKKAKTLFEELHPEWVEPPRPVDVQPVRWELGGLEANRIANIGLEQLRERAAQAGRRVRR